MAQDEFPDHHEDTDFDNPFQPPSSTGAISATEDDGERNGPPWEQDGPFLSRFWNTTKGVLFDPKETFLRMRREGGMGPPLLFGFIGGFVAGIVGAVYSYFYMQYLTTLDPETFQQPFGPTAQFVLQVGFIPVSLIFFFFFGSGILHLMLLLFKGANHPFQTTFRVVVYAYGSTALMTIVPGIGNLAQFIWAPVVTIIGLSYAQNTSIGKAAAAVLIPIALTLLCFCGFFIFAVAMIAGQLGNV